ncbi:MAG: DUF2927 domain-containing protein [Proteobacteria bacterium]|nr:DUF2927 domain-containing protein [Pseudomonadota bacterium]
MRVVSVPADADVLVETFRTVTFGGNDYPQNERLEKWERPIRLRVVGDLPAGAEVLPKIVSTFSEVAALPIEILLPPDPGEPNERLLILSAQSYQDVAARTAFPYRVDESTCSTYPARTLILIRTGMSTARTRDCVGHELLHLLGFRDHATTFSGSILGPAQLFADEPTINDLILLRTLYDPRLRAGMPRDEAM